MLLQTCLFATLVASTVRAAQPFPLEPMMLFAMQMLSIHAPHHTTSQKPTTTQAGTIQTLTKAVTSTVTAVTTATSSTAATSVSTATAVPDSHGGMNFAWAPPPGLAPVHPEWTAYFKKTFPYATATPDILSCASSVDANYWGISFDDGPTENTHVVLDYFARQKLSTTFWVIGSSVQDAAKTLLDTHMAGHDIGSHSWSHKDLTTLSEDEIVAELVYGARAVFEVVGKMPRYFRPPYGAIDDRVRRVAAYLGLQAVKWSHDTQDWANVQTNSMQNVPRSFETWIQQGVVRPITLAHDLYPETVAVVGQSMDLLLKAGKVPVKLSRCLDVGTVYGNDALDAFFGSGLFPGSSGGKSAAAAAAAAAVVGGIDRSEALEGTRGLLKLLCLSLLVAPCLFVAGAQTVAPDDLSNVMDQIMDLYRTHMVHPQPAVSPSPPSKPPTPSPSPSNTQQQTNRTLANVNFRWAPSGSPPAYPTWTSYFRQSQTNANLPLLTKCADSANVNVWGASFDDGPSESTHLVTEYFAPKNMRATFWIIGSNVPKYPKALLDAYNAGHDIGIHTWSHPRLPELSDDQIVSELVYGARAIFEVTGKMPKFFRPPYGAIDDRVRAIGSYLGLEAVTWSHDTLDWSYVASGTTQQRVPQAFQGWLQQGITRAITLQHDIFEETVAAIPQSMDVLINAGRTIVPLSKCLNIPSAYGNPTLEAFFASGLFENPYGGKTKGAWRHAAVDPGSGVAKSRGIVKAVRVEGPKKFNVLQSHFINENNGGR
ncbi:chitin deacetylase [Chytriomyces hyalinus]|nr:chitin deacetylase [Chytriomyces hyalinus]